MNNPDDDLIRLASDGHRPAFDLLIARTSRLIWSHHILRTRNRELAEDLTQETYLRAWRAMGQLKEVADFRSWLIAIAERVRLDEYKNRTRLKRGSAATMESDPPADAETPAESVEKRDLAHRALAALGDLPEQYQQPLSLRYLAGADAEEISRQLAITNGSLRGLLHRGLQMLREKLGDD